MVVSARLVSGRILAGAQDQNLAVTITAPTPSWNRSTERPPLSLAIVIDRSGSMHGAPIENAKAAALSVLRQLDRRDAFAVVTYSSSSETVLPMQRATDAYPMTRAGRSVVVPVADMRAGETRKVVFRVTVAAAHQGPLVISQVEVGWRQVSDGVQRAAHTAAEVEVVDDPAAVAASIDPATMPVVEQALSARALEQAAAAYENGGIEEAKQVLDRRARAVRANAAYLGADTAESLEAVSRDAIDGFAKAPAQAKKAASVKAYELAR